MRLFKFPGLCCWSGIKAPMGVSGVCLPWYWTCWVTAGLALTDTSLINIYKDHLNHNNYIKNKILCNIFVFNTQLTILFNHKTHQHHISNNSIDLRNTVRQKERIRMR